MKVTACAAMAPLLGALDTTIHVVKTLDGLRTATVIKANDSEEGEQVAFTLESVTVGEDVEGNRPPRRS